LNHGLDATDDGGPIARPSGAAPALKLATSYGYDAAGNRSKVVDPLGRTTIETYDALGRLRRRDLPMGVFEALAYDGEGRVTSRTDRRGIERRAVYDLAGRATAEQLVESISAAGQVLSVVTRTYSDTADGNGVVGVAEKDALGRSTIRDQDAMHREVRVTDPASYSRFTAYDAVNLRAAKDRKGYVTEYDYDAANRPVAQRDLDLGGGVRYAQTTVYDDAARVETALDRNGIPTKRERDGLGRTRPAHGGVGPTS